MRAFIQRVTEASVRIDGQIVGQIGAGLLVLLGVKTTDTRAEADWLAEKLPALRIFEDSEGKMNLSLQETGGELLVVSQFTLYGDARKGRRPSYIEAAQPPVSEPLYEYFVEKLRQSGIKVETGRFGADMAVSLINDGPVTIIIDSKLRE